MTVEKNRHQYIGWTDDDPTPRQIIGGPMTGWMFSDAVRQQACPKCGSDAGWNCQSAAGRKVWPPHNARTSALVAKTGLKPFQGVAISPASILNPGE